MVKASLRREVAAAARAAEESEAERWWNTGFAEESRARLREAVARLKKG